MAQQGPQPEWQGLINKLASLDEYNTNFTAGIESMRTTIKSNVEIMKSVNTILENLKKRVSGTLVETTKIIEALKKGSQDQTAKITQLEAYRGQLTADIKDLDTQIQMAKTNTDELNNSLGATQPQVVGGKRRRRTRSKGKKYHKRTKRGGYKYGKDKDKDKDRGKKKSQ